MITNLSTRREFCIAGLFSLLPSFQKQPNKLKLPLPEFQIGERVRTERVCDDCRSPNYLGIDWECGFIVGYVWSYDEWWRDEYRQGWIYWIRYDQSNYENFGDRQFIGFAHQSEIIQV